jgi:hypothetical protein
MENSRLRQLALLDLSILNFGLMRGVTTNPPYILGVFGKIITGPNGAANDIYTGFTEASDVRAILGTLLFASRSRD